MPFLAEEENPATSAIGTFLLDISRSLMLTMLRQSSRFARVGDAGTMP